MSYIHIPKTKKVELIRKKQMAEIINIKKIATLSMINLSEEEQKIFSNDITETIRLINELLTSQNLRNAQIDTFSDNSVSDREILRNDTVTNENNRSNLLKNATKNDGQYIVVPKVIERS